ncbi:MAG: hypothetical protein WBA12_14465 [Catalinimonas sp.]
MFRRARFAHLLFLALAAACGPDDPVDPNENPDALPLRLGDQEWRLTSLTSDQPRAFGGGVSSTDWLANLDPCYRDNRIDFDAQIAEVRLGTLYLEAGPLRCDPSDPQRDDEMDWRLPDGDSLIVVERVALFPQPHYFGYLVEGRNGVEHVENWRILKLTPDSLVVTYPVMPADDSVTYQLTARLAR